jgi:predicted transcriptional regulator
MPSMTKTLKEVMRRAETWPKERQQEALRLLLEMEARDTSTYQLSEEEAADIDEALKEVERGEVATEEEVKVVFNRFRA